MYKVFQDGQGYVWALTDYGPQRHNGKQFEMVPGFSASDPPAYNFYIDKQKRLWLYTAKGEIGEYRQGQFRRHPISPRLAAQTAERNSFAFNVKEGLSGRMYFESFRNLVCWDKAQVLDTVRPGDQHAWTVQRIDGQWLTNRGILKTSFLKNKEADDLLIPLTIYDYLPAPVTLKLPFSGLTKYRLMATEGPEGLLVTVGNQAILVRKDGQVQVKSYPFSIVFNKLINQRFYFGFYNLGLARLDTDLENLTFLLTDVSVSDAWADADGHLWVSSLEKGVFREKEPGLHVLPSIPGRTSMLKPMGSVLMVGTENGELYQIGPQRRVKTLRFPGQRSSKVLDIMAYGDGFLLGTHSGVFHWNGEQTFDLIREKRTRYLTVGQYITRLPGGRTLLSHSRGLMTFDGKELTLLPSFPFKVRELIFWEDRLWLATDDGVKSVQLVQDEVRVDTTYMQGTRILRLKEHEGRLWFSAPGKGICNIDRQGKARQVPGLQAHAPVMDFCFVRSDQVLVASFSGLGSLNPATGAYQKLSEMATLRVALFDDQVWLGTINGLMVRTWPISDKEVQIPFFLRKLEENGHSRSYVPGMALEARNQSLTFSFDLLGYGKTDAGLWYELNGPKKRAGVTGTTVLSFADLPPGDYQLKVRAWWNGKAAGPQVMLFRFAVSLAFYETWWFRLVAALLGLVGLVLGIRMTLAYYRRKDAEANRLQQRLAGSKITALQSQMNPHFVSNALTAIQNLIITSQLEEAIGYIAKFSRMLRMVLELSGKPFVSLEKELQVIRYNVGLEQLRFRQKFDFELHVSPDLSPDALFVPTLITQPFVENAIWHGLLPLQDQRKGRLSISIRKEGAFLLLEIEDNGVGRHREGQQKKDQESFGHQLTASRFDNLNKLLGQSLCQLVIEDLINETTGETGTLVRLQFPSNFHEIKDQSLFT